MNNNRFFPILLILVTLSAISVQAQTAYVLSAGSKEPLNFATITNLTQGASIVSNEDGAFSTLGFKESDSISIIYMGYTNRKLLLKDIIGDTLQMSPFTQILDEVIVRGLDPLTIINRIKANLSKNYSDNSQNYLVRMKETTLKDGICDKSLDALMKLNVSPFSKEATESAKLELLSVNLISKDSNKLSVAVPVKKTLGQLFNLKTLLKMLDAKDLSFDAAVYRDESGKDWYKISFTGGSEKGLFYADPANYAILQWAGTSTKGKNTQDLRLFFESTNAVYYPTKIIFKGHTEVNLGIKKLNFDLNSYMSFSALPQSETVINNMSEKDALIKKKEYFNKPVDQKLWDQVPIYEPLAMEKGE